MEFVFNDFSIKEGFIGIPEISKKINNRWFAN